ncbi:GDSL esterase/lipase CPRD49-like isoform X1 [Cynara cardunculus var. scolymus]|uniref:GDSL esterase/lipase CPRD49-like isoform X1 n=1 Tax=Cynara cardunculus var. scolymus TaxID=59895 RepID=UPI000D62E85C|nr:GDSL esterase/lipase CPRD49-like isoform X1 [Cynara cardunculus var. scolymus]
MVGPRRPHFVLFGSSIVEFSYGNEGWGATLAHIYARKADIFLRGYRSWNSRQAVQVLDQVFPKDEAVQPSLVIVYFGGNDSVRPQPGGLSSHVPLFEYVENMRKIAIHLKVSIGRTKNLRGKANIESYPSLSEKTRIIFLTSPPVNEAQILTMLGTKGRTNEWCQKYADACVNLCREMGIKAIDLCAAFKQQHEWATTCFTDGIHLTPVGSKIVAKEILKAVKEADWKPSLHWESLPTEFIRNKL